MPKVVMRLTMAYVGSALESVYLEISAIKLWSGMIIGSYLKILKRGKN